MTESELRDLIGKKMYEIGDALMEYYDCCGIRGSSCKAGEENPCCTGRTIFGNGCPFMIANSCHNPNCDCKLWLCATAIATTDPKCVETLKLLEQIGILYGVVRPPLIGQPYSGADRR